MKRKILFVSLFAFVFLMFPYSQASALGPFPATGQTFSYNILGEADWDYPLDVTIGWRASASFSVTAVGTGEFTLQQTVTGNPIWPTSTGTGSIDYWDVPGSSIDPETSTTAFSFTSTGDLDSDTGVVSSVSGDEYAFVWLNWTSGADEVFAYVGLHTHVFFFPAPVPFCFISEGLEQMWYWNTSYDPWQALMPAVWTAPWNEEGVATALGLRNSYRFTDDFTASAAPLYGETVFDIWMDYDTGILLKMNDTTLITSSDTMYDVRMTTLIDIAACSFMVAPIPVVLIVGVIAAIVIIIVVIFLLYWFILRKRK